MQDLAYREHRPVERLREHVQCLWELRGRCDEVAPQLIVPDGCMGLVLNFGAPVEQVVAVGKVLQQPQTQFIGELRRPVTMQSSGNVELLGVQFWPGAARSFIDASAPSVVDRIVDASVLRSSLARRIARTVYSADEHRRISLLQIALLEQLEQPSRCKALVRGAVRALVRAQGCVEIERLASAFGVSRRHLERRFVEEVGIAPKSLASVLRFRRALRLVDEARADSADVALACGYYDQSHLIRDFKRFTGCSPSRYRRESHTPGAPGSASRPR